MLVLVLINPVSASINYVIDGETVFSVVNENETYTLGNVGIGTSSPSNELHVNGSSGTTGFLVEDVGVDSNPRIRLTNDNREWGIEVNSDDSFVIHNAGAGIRPFRIDENSNVMINDEGRAVDFRVESDDDTHMLFVDGSADKIGIGTSAPQAKLMIAEPRIPIAGTTVIGQLMLGDSVNTNKRLVLGYDTANVFGYIQSVISGISFQPLALQPFGGNVGIGTKSPDEALHVAGASAIIKADGSGTVRLQAISSDGQAIFGLLNSVSNDLHIQYSLNDGATLWNMGVDATDSFFKIGQGSNPSNGGKNIVLDTNGRVGIGTATPGVLLEVNASNTTAGFHVQGKNATGTTVTQLYVQNGSGSVGIGTSSPAEDLHVADNIRADGFVQVLDSVRAGFSNDGTPGAPHYTFNGDTNTGMYSDTADNLAFSTASTNAMYIDDSQNVGIGTATPQQPLNVIGDLNVTGNYIHNSNTGFTGSCVNVTYSGGIATTCND